MTKLQTEIGETQCQREFPWFRMIFPLLSGSGPVCLRSKDLRNSVALTTKPLQCTVAKSYTGWMIFFGHLTCFPASAIDFPIKLLWKQALTKSGNFRLPAKGIEWRQLLNTSIESRMPILMVFVGLDLVINSVVACLRARYLITLNIYRSRIK